MLICSLIRTSRPYSTTTPVLLLRLFFPSPLQELRDREPVRRLRLFGKIFGSKANYIVVEAVYIPEGWPDMEAPVVLPEGSLDDLAGAWSRGGGRG